MKKILLLLFVLQLSLNCMSQQLSNVVDFKLPAGAQKVDDKLLQTQSTENGKHIIKLPYKEVKYVVDGVRISFIDLYFPNKESQEPLEKTMAKSLEPEEMKPEYTNIKSFIKTYNNIRFLIKSYDDFKGGSFFMIYSEWHNDKSLTCTLQFNKANAEKGNSIMNEILNTMKFKD